MKEKDFRGPKMSGFTQNGEILLGFSRGKFGSFIEEKLKIWGLNSRKFEKCVFEGDRKGWRQMALCWHDFFLRKYSRKVTPSNMPGCSFRRCGSMRFGDGQ